MLEIFCLTIGNGNPFSIMIEGNKSVHCLKQFIINEFKYQFHASALTLYLAKKNNNWIKNHNEEIEEINHNKNIEKNYEKMDETFDIVEYINTDMELIKKRIHVLVKLPADAPLLLIDPYIYRNNLTIKQINLQLKKKRWAQINKALDENRNSKVKRGSDGEVSTCFSCISWGSIEEIYKQYLEPWKMGTKSIGPAVSDHLYQMIITYTKAFRPVNRGTSAEIKRLYFISPILACVINLFNGEMEIKAEENINGKLIHANGRFDFVLVRGKNRVCVIEAKKYDMDQGMAQNLVACEVLSEMEDIDQVYGIVTNYERWIFLSVLPSIVKIHEISLVDENGYACQSSIETIAGKIFWMLSNSDS